MSVKFWSFAAIVALAAYLIGSVSFAVIVSRVGAQDDVRRHGSGNAGMTNILRNYGKKWRPLRRSVISARGLSPWRSDA